MTDQKTKDECMVLALKVATAIAEDHYYTAEDGVISLLIKVNQWKTKEIAAPKPLVDSLKAVVIDDKSRTNKTDPREHKETQETGVE